MDQVRIGVIGVGRMGQRHCRVYSNLRRVRMVGVCDANPQLGSQVASQYGVPYFSRVDDLLDQVDAVSLAVPTPLHYDLAKHCIEKDKHLLIEKPMAETLEQAETITKLAEGCGLIVQVGHIERFNPAFVELKNVMEERTVLAINLRRLSPFIGSNLDVDVVGDLMIHDTDLALNLVGKHPLSIEAFGLTASDGRLDHVVAHLFFENGPLLTMTASRITEHKVRSIEVTAADAYLECDLLNKNVLVSRHTIGEYLNHNHKGVKYHQESLVERIQVPAFEPLFSELSHFVECVLEGKTPSVSARDGMDALRLVESIRAQAQKNLVYMAAIQSSGSQPLGQTVDVKASVAMGG
jgi:predicted dehydrogenase